MPRSIFIHLATVLAGTLLLAATSSSAGPVESAQPTIDDALIYEIVTHARPVLLITQLTNNNHILVIIGGAKYRGDFVLADLHVFEQPLENLGHDSIHLKPSTPFLTRWPTVAGWNLLGMFAVPDSTGDNIILGDDSNYNAYALQLSTGTIEALPKIDDSAVTNLGGYCTLSSAKPVHFLWIFSTYTSLWVEQYFNSDTLDQATEVPQGKSYYICDNGLSSRGQRIRVSSVKCKLPTKWNITAGFINATSVVLVDKTNSVLIFDSSVFTSGNPTDVVKIPAEKFWVKWVRSQPRPSSQTRVLSTEKLVTMSTESTTPPTAKWPVVLVLTIAIPNLLLVLCLIALGIYCLCKTKQPSDKSVLANPPKLASRPHNKQDNKSAVRTVRKGGTKEKPGSSAVNLKTKAASSSTVAKKANASSSLHLPGKSATSASKTSKNANASTSKRSLAGPSAPSPGTPYDIFPHPPLPFV